MRRRGQGRKKSKMVMLTEASVSRRRSMVAVRRFVDSFTAEKARLHADSFTAKKALLQYTRAWGGLGARTRSESFYDELRRLMDDDVGGSSERRLEDGPRVAGDRGAEDCGSEGPAERVEELGRAVVEALREVERVEGSPVKAVRINLSVEVEADIFDAGRLVYFASVLAGQTELADGPLADLSEVMELGQYLADVHPLIVGLHRPAESIEEFVSREASRLNTRLRVEALRRFVELESCVTSIGTDPSSSSEVEPIFHPNTRPR